MRLILVLGLLLSTLPAFAQKRGLGVSVGNPTGFNGKYWLSGVEAVDGGLGFSIGKNTDFNMHSDYLWHKRESFYLNDVYPLDLYFGLGGRLEFSDDIEIGIRLPIGFSHDIKEKSADVFAEVAPVVEVITKKGLEMHLLFGGRYYF
jgi:hypothetical protein